LNSVDNEIVAPIFPLYALNVGATLVEVGLLLTVLSLVTIMTRLPILEFTARLGMRKLVIVACGIQILSLMLFLIASSTVWLLMAMILYGVSAGSFGPLAASAVLNTATPRRRGEIIGKYCFAYGLAVFLGPTLTSVLVWFFNYQQMFATIILFPVLAFVASISIRIE